MSAAIDRPSRRGPVTYEVVRAGLLWRWRTGIGASGWALSREGAKHKAVASIQRRNGGSA